MPDLQVDTLQIQQDGGIAALGTVAQRLLANGMNVSGLRTNDVLTKEEWLQYDTTVVQIARSRLVGVGDLMTRGLRYDLNNGLGTTVVQWDQASDMSPANISMSGVTPGEEDRMLFALKSIPIPIVHKDFRINIRNLIASRRSGEALDTTQAALAARLVSEKLETILFKGATIQAAGGTIYGYTNFPNRNTGTAFNWADAVNVDGNEIISDVLEMLAAMMNDNMYGPYGIYVPFDYWNRLQDDYKAASDRTILERILAIEGIEFIRPSKDLTGGATGQIIMVQLTSDVVDMINGMQPTTVQWESHGGMQVHFKIMAILVPRLKADQATQCGVCHWTAA